MNEMEKEKDRVKRQVEATRKRLAFLKKIHQPLQTIELPSIQSRFEIEKAIGKGTYGTVYKALSNTTKNPVALKVISKETKTTSNEVKILLALSPHPNIPRVYSYYYFTDTKNVAIEMELIDGSDWDKVNLLKVVKEQKQDKIVWNILKGAIAGLSFIHQHEIAHRDIKPENLRIHRHGNEYDTILMDFGLSCFLPQCLETACKDAKRDHIVGSFLYISPDRLITCSLIANRTLLPQSEKETLLKNDVWALGMSCWYLLKRNDYDRQIQTFLSEMDIMNWHRRVDFSNMNFVQDFEFLSEKERDGLNFLIRSMLLPKDELRPSASQLMEILTAFELHGF